MIIMKILIMLPVRDAYILAKPASRQMSATLATQMIIEQNLQIINAFVFQVIFFYNH